VRTGARDVMQNVATALRHHSRPELVARKLLHLVAATDSVVEARALSIGAQGHTEVLATTGGSDGPVTTGCRHRLQIGSVCDRSIAVDVSLRPDIAPRAALHAVRLLLATIQDLERSRAEREQRMSLWPEHDDSREPAGAVVSGHMRELMSYAKRVARTSVSVFITGESGTGKEVLARAIHQLSDRAGQPFIPFNCATVPRDMLESQLFGHRRGSFTGADRDHEGVIGATRAGTLFLDEIGELGPDCAARVHMTNSAGAHRN